MLCTTRYHYSVVRILLGKFDDVGKIKFGLLDRFALERPTQPDAASTAVCESTAELRHLPFDVVSMQCGSNLKEHF